ncbi:hypothetical protein E4N62_24905 [Streptomyces sp. MNU76]|uniref:hypothetical protein n=1 Tax=Streptomyces sp. MNU76 TaxID=2560026 RepID=UPI001E30E1A3|nr:hypothetical protein [Streptomyces sp. MNU76]MCC9708212.1 hypothetical protein [Streptomyces sp. MNU76]
MPRRFLRTTSRPNLDRQLREPAARCLALFRTLEYPNLPILADATGKERFYALGGPLGGAYALDQAFHHAVETVAAVIAASE